MSTASKRVNVPFEANIIDRIIIDGTGNNFITLEDHKENLHFYN